MHEGLDAIKEGERSLKETGLNQKHFVTTDGEVLEPSGIVFGGVMRGVLKVRRQIKEIEKDILFKKEEVASTESAVIELKDGSILAAGKTTSSSLGVQGGNSDAFPEVYTDKECRAYCQTCNKFVELKKGDRIPPCCGKLMEILDD